MNCKRNFFFVFSKSTATVLKLFFLLFVALSITSASRHKEGDTSWIRINLLGYTRDGSKVAVWAGNTGEATQHFQLIDSSTNQVVFDGPAGKEFGAYGPFSSTYRLNFSNYKKPGVYYLKAGAATSPLFRIDDSV